MISFIPRVIPNYVESIVRKADFLPSQASDVAQMAYDTFEYTVDDRFKHASGNFVDKKFAVTTHSKFQHRSITGQIEDSNFKITHEGRLFKSDKITGHINNKPLDLVVEEGFLKDFIFGKLGDKTVKLKYYSGISGVDIIGEYNDKPVAVTVGDHFSGGKISGKDIDLRIDMPSLYSDDVKIVGEYNSDPELVPLLLDFVYAKADELTPLDIMF